MSRQRFLKGQWAESYVCRFLQIHGFRLVSANLKTPWAQLDLLMQTPQGKMLILEVKYLSFGMDPQSRLSTGQRQRLERARFGLMDQSNRPVALGLAYVSPLGKIDFIDLDEL